ncbi:hypothetical protein [Paenibacillus rigui]|uniref:Flagellar hook-associated protein 2 C-terminal domain-containing protein n=1 Tax=Paenibacillus rigui TaxID=554312 RepID=A0A229UIW0_9BACL|nr:hypothetical protein [Paenibacillus rigui]OXM83388.1 hypothetical protein CF651_26185 [Paenibacillus rigui]
MYFNVMQVARTYRANALWHSGEEAWRQRGRSLPSRLMAPVEPKRSAPVPGAVVPSSFEQFALETTQGLAAVLNAAVRVKQAVRKLAADSQMAALDQRTVRISHPDVLSAFAAPGAQIRSYTIQVDQAAAAPLVEGTVLPSQAETAIAVGSNQMKLTYVDGTAPFSVYIVRSDTNLQALRKIQAALNQMSLPVKASLILDDDEGTVRLRVEGTMTGSGHTFAITDVYGSAAHLTGIGPFPYTGKDAHYRVDDGEQIVSAANQVMLDNGKVTLTLLEASELPVELSILPDSFMASQGLHQVTARYNELLAALQHGLRFLNRPNVNRAFEEAEGLGLSLALNPVPVVAAVEAPDEQAEGQEQEAEPLPDTPWNRIGLSQFPDGTLQVDAAALEQLLAARFTEWQAQLRAPEGPVSTLVRSLNRLLSLPTEELLDKRKAAYRSFASYQFRPWGSLRTYLPLPLSGMLVNRMF